MIADGNQISICSGALFNYSITHKYYIKLDSAAQGTCKDFVLISNMMKGIFYQQFGQVFQVFDNRINLIFTAIKKPQGRTAIPKAPTLIVPDPEPVVTAPTASSGFSSGKYFTLLLFNRGQGRKRTQISDDKIVLQLCSTLTFNYKLNENNRIEVESTSQVDKNCSKADEQLFFDVITSAVRYEVDTDGAINLIDGDGRSVVVFTFD